MMLEQIAFKIASEIRFAHLGVSKSMSKPELCQWFEL